MEYSSLIITTIGSLFLSGVIVETTAENLNLPRVTLLIVLGILIGPSVLNIIPDDIIVTWFPVITNVALSMIGFLLANKMSINSLKNIGAKVFKLSIAVLILTFIIILIGLVLFNVPLKIALLLAALATATDPAATYDVITELKKDTSFTEFLLDIVAIDDIWCLITFSIVLSSVHMMNGNYISISHSIYGIIHEIGGAVILATLIGLPAAYLLGRIMPGEATLVEALGVVFLSSGLSLYFGVSLILTSIILGIVIKSFAKQHRCAFHAIEGIERPFMVLFFVLAGASFDITMMQATSLIGIIYILFRIVGRFIGGWFGGMTIKSNLAFKKWIGPALLPQAGVAIGLGLITSQNFPEYRNIILPIILSSTIVFEILGPILTRKAIIKNT